MIVITSCINLKLEKKMKTLKLFKYDMARGNSKIFWNFVIFALFSTALICILRHKGNWDIWVEKLEVNRMLPKKNKCFKHERSNLSYWYSIFILKEPLEMSKSFKIYL